MQLSDWVSPTPVFTRESLAATHLNTWSNHFAGKLAEGEHNAVLISGAELLASLFSSLRTGDDISAWAGGQEAEPTTIGKERDGLNATEKLYSLYEPIQYLPSV